MRETEDPGMEAHAAPGPGATLRMAREARGMTVVEVAAALKLSPRQIEAIEAEDFSRLSGATFVRGFIRNYARLLKIEAAPVLAALPEQALQPLLALNAPENEGVKMPSRHARQGKGLLGATVLALGVLGVALALYFDLVDVGDLVGRQDGLRTQSAIAMEGRRHVIQPPTLPVAQPSALPVDAPAMEMRSAEAGVQPQPDTDARKLVFSFDDSSWVEVKDAAGRTIFSQMNAKGTTQVVEGRPPFQLVVGNASRVRLQYKEQPIDLRPHTRVEVARLTLD